MRTVSSTFALLAVFLFAGMAWGQTPGPWAAGLTTNDSVNCRWWNRFAAKPSGMEASLAASKSELAEITDLRFATATGFVTGIRELWSTLMATDADVPKPPPGTTLAEYADGISAVCQKPENANMKVVLALVLFFEKVNGWPETALEGLAANFRAASVAPAAPPVPTK